MGSAASVTVEGAATFERTLERAAGKIAHPTTAAAEASRIIAVEASTLAPRLTGALASSIAAEPADGEARAVSGLVYAGVIEYGWRAHNIAPAGFMAGALASTQSRVLDVYSREIQNDLNQVKGI